MERNEKISKTENGLQREIRNQSKIKWILKKFFDNPTNSLNFC